MPGSTSNIGPGYDCLGIALAMYNEVTVSRDVGDAPEGTPEHAMVAWCAKDFFARSKVRPFPFRWEIAGEVPMCRGLGSSVTLQLGILQGLNNLCGEPLTTEEIFELCAIIDGHPDNAAPSIFGGFVIANTRGDWFRFEVDLRLKFVLLIPEIEVPTDPAREVLPSSVLHTDAVRGMINACTITAAFATREYEKLRGSFDDYLHQTYRQHLVPGMFNVILAATEAGALGGFLSGSGSTIACVTVDDNGDRIASAMQEAYTAGHETRTLVVAADNTGTAIVV